MGTTAEKYSEDDLSTLPTAQQAEILNQLIAGYIILSVRLNSATKYHHVIARPGTRVEIKVSGQQTTKVAPDVDLEGDEVSQAALERMTAQKWIRGKIAGAGLAPPIEYSVTDLGRRVAGLVADKQDNRKGRR